MSRKKIEIPENLAPDIGVLGNIYFETLQEAKIIYDFLKQNKSSELAKIELKMFDIYSGGGTKGGLFSLTRGISFGKAYTKLAGDTVHKICFRFNGGEIVRVVSKKVPFEKRVLRSLEITTQCKTSIQQNEVHHVIAVKKYDQYKKAAIRFLQGALID